MDVLSFALEIGKLKQLQRTGWVREGVPNPESVADHSFRVAVLGLALAPKLGLNANQVVAIAVVHDLGEAKIGDLVSGRGAVAPAAAEKDAAEFLAFSEIVKMVDREDVSELLLDFQSQRSAEARFVKELDKFDMAVQAFEYQQQHGLQLEEFFQNADLAISTPILREAFNELLLRRA